MDDPSEGTFKFDAYKALDEPGLRVIINRLLQTRYSPLSRETGLTIISKTLPRFVMVTGAR
jgi:hypothetical protein